MFSTLCATNARWLSVKCLRFRLSETTISYARNQTATIAPQETFTTVHKHRKTNCAWRYCAGRGRRWGGADSDLYGRNKEYLLASRNYRNLPTSFPKLRQPVTQMVTQNPKQEKSPLNQGLIPCTGGEEGIRTLVPGFPDHPISSRRRYDRFGTSPLRRA